MNMLEDRHQAAVLCNSKSLASQTGKNKSLRHQAEAELFCCRNSFCKMEERHNLRRFPPSLPQQVNNITNSCTELPPFAICCERKSNHLPSVPCFSHFEYPSASGTSFLLAKTQRCSVLAASLNTGQHVVHTCVCVRARAPVETCVYVLYTFN